MPRIYNKWKDKNIPEDAIYVGRPSYYGNPFEMGKDGTRSEVIQKYREYVMGNPEMLEKIKNDLKGKDLVCWCWPLHCHAEVLLEIANDIKPEKGLW